VGEFRNRAYWHRRHLRLGESWVEGTDTYEASAPAALHFHFAPEVEVRQESSSSFVLRTPGHTLRLELLDGAGELRPALFSGGYRLLQPTPPASGCANYGDTSLPLAAGAAVGTLQLEIRSQEDVPLCPGKKWRPSAPAA
jgi:hypothetical protein